MMNLRSIGRIAAVVLGTLLFLPQHAGSEGLGIDVSPAKLEISIPAGQSYNIPVTVHNSSTDATHVQATMVDFGVDPAGNYRFMHVGSQEHSLMRWASINPREFDLPAGTSQQVRLTIVVPPDQKLSGEYAGIVFFQTRPQRRAGTNVAFSARVASKIYETIPDTFKVSGAITKMAAAAGYGGERYRVVFRNTGNSHEYLRGQLQVEQGGTVIDRVAMPEQMLVERGGERVVELNGKHLGHGDYQAVATIDYGGATETGGATDFRVP